MRRALIIVAAAAVAAIGGVWTAGAVAPCALPRALTDKIAPDKAAACPALAAAERPRSVDPPAISVISAVKREFVDRLFVSGTLVAREEAQVAARIDGLTIVEIDAEDGDRVKKGQVLARLDRSQLDALMAQNDAATRRADAAIDQAESLIAAISGANAIRQRRFRSGAQAWRRRDGRVHDRAARDGDEDGAGPIGRRPECARGRRGRSQEPRRRAAGASGAHRPHRGEGARGGHRQPAVGQGRRVRFHLGRAAVPHHRGRSDRSRSRRARAVAGQACRRHAGAVELPGVDGPGLGPRAAREPGGRQGEPHRQGAHRARGRSATRTSAPSPRARSNSRAATASACRRPRWRRRRRGAPRCRARRQGRGAASDGRHRRRRRWRSRPASPTARASSPAPPLSCALAIGCGRRRNRPQPPVKRPTP